MLTSITPLGERGRASRYWVTIVAYLVGSMSGGTVVGALAGALGAALPRGGAVASAAIVLVVLVAGWGALVEIGMLPGPPGVRRQVDEDWLHRYRGWVYGVGYGAQLGLGVVTIITSMTLHVTLLLAWLTGSPGAGALVGLVFGTVRAAPVLGLRHVHTPGQLAQAARQVERLAPLARRGSAAMLSLVALTGTVQLL